MSDPSVGVIVARCGLVCSNCGMFRTGKCAGCPSETPMFKNCPVKACAILHEHDTCAQCTQFGELKECRKLHNFISRAFGFVFRTDRIGNLVRIREVGLDAFREERAGSGRK